jgi:hypothetical protein
VASGFFLVHLVGDRKVALLVFDFDRSPKECVDRKVALLVFDFDRSPKEYVQEIR